MWKKEDASYESSLPFWSILGLTSVYTTTSSGPSQCMKPWSRHVAYETGTQSHDDLLAVENAIKRTGSHVHLIHQPMFGARNERRPHLAEVNASLDEFHLSIQSNMQDDLWVTRINLWENDSHRWQYIHTYICFCLFVLANCEQIAKSAQIAEMVSLHCDIRQVWLRMENVDELTFARHNTSASTLLKWCSTVVDDVSIIATVPSSDAEKKHLPSIDTYIMSYVENVTWYTHEQPWQAWRNTRDKNRVVQLEGIITGLLVHRND